MRIGLMLRAFDEKGGVGVYTRNIVEELLGFDRRNQYILFYRNREHLGRYSHYENVTERWVRGGSKAAWDQIAIPLACRREKVDVLFHPKFTAPLLAPCRVVMVVHGADWFIPEQAQFYGKLDVRYIRMVMPWYFRKCSVVISVSELTTDNFNQVLRLPAGKVKTVYFGPARHFVRVTDRTELEQVRTRYDLPEEFVLTLTKRGGGTRKNLGKLLEAYARYHASVPNPRKLVIGGKDCHLYRADYSVPEDGYGADIVFPGWIDQQDLPAVYSSASLYLYPSNLEAFPIPLTEAMACGTPIVTSNINGLEEIAGDAALLVDPTDSRDIASALERVLTDPALSQSLSAQGLERSKRFSWDRCVSETLAILEQVGGSSEQ
ncbi:MAG: glycosyltransferase family 1 protein [Thermoanaerobaculia bacterium]